MAALNPGKKAPAVELPLMGGGTFSLAEALSHGRVALAFFKVSCPVCQYSFPYFERLSQRLKDKDIRFFGVSQDDAPDTLEFAKAFGVTFPIALDSPDRYAVSAAYGLTNVPTLFVIGSDGVIEHSIVSWSKKDMEELYGEYLDSATVQSPLFGHEERVSDFKAG